MKSVKLILDLSHAQQKVDSNLDEAELKVSPVWLNMATRFTLDFPWCLAF